MAFVFIDVRAACNPNITPCSDVYLCLTQDWDDKTVCGLALARGSITSINFATIPQIPNPCCDASSPTLCPEECIYQIQIDDAQFLIDPQTQLPYVITADDVLEIFPYACILEELIQETIKTPIGLEASINNPAQQFNHGDTITFLGGECIQTTAQNVDSVLIDLVLDPAGGNLLTCSAAGLFIDCPAIVSPTVDNLLTCNAGGLFIDCAAILSGTGGNILTCDANGIYLDCVAVNACIPAPADIGLVSNSGPAQAFNHGDTISILGGVSMAGVASAVDTVTLDLVLSGDPGQLLTFSGGDGNIFLDCTAVATCIIPQTDITLAGDSGPSQPFNHGDTITIAGGVSMASVASAVDTVTVNLLLSTDVGQLLTFGGVDGNIFLDCTAVASCIIPQTAISLAGDSGPVQSFNHGDTVTIAGGTSISTVASAPDTITVGLDLSTDAGQLLKLGGVDGNIFLECADVLGCAFNLAAAVRFPTLGFFGAPAIASLQTGSALITTPAFVMTVFFNPDPVNPMPVLIIATGSFAGDSVPGTGTVVWGHSLWIDGVLVPDRDGRTNPGFNISWSDSVGVLQDYDLPVIVYPHVIPGGGSVTVGLDFGDNGVFPTIGTALSLSLESRQIAIIGSNA